MQWKFSIEMKLNGLAITVQWFKICGDASHTCLWPERWSLLVNYAIKIKFEDVFIIRCHEICVTKISTFHISASHPYNIPRYQDEIIFNEFVCVVMKALSRSFKHGDCTCSNFTWKQLMMMMMNLLPNAIRKNFISLWAVWAVREWCDWFGLCYDGRWVTVTHQFITEN